MEHLRLIPLLYKNNKEIIVYLLMSYIQIKHYIPLAKLILKIIFNICLKM